MAKDFLAFLGMVFLILILLALVLVVGYTYDLLGLVELPEAVPTTLARVLGPREATPALALGVSTPEWKNPLDDFPESGVADEPTRAPATPTPLPPTATAILPMEAAAYRTEQVLNLKQLTRALEGWLEANRRLGQDHGLHEDPAWRAEMDDWLTQIDQSGQALANTGPAPLEYQTAAGLLGQVGQAAILLSADYRQALQTYYPKDFQKAGDDFERLKAYLSEAVTEMIAAGWSLE